MRCGERRTPISERKEGKLPASVTVLTGAGFRPQLHLTCAFEKLPRYCHLREGLWHVSERHFGSLH